MFGLIKGSLAHKDPFFSFSFLLLVHLESIMHPLLAFLKSHVGSSHASEHPCAWLSTLFIEQDDDMLEAAKTLLTVHLKFERLVSIFTFLKS